MVLVLDMHLFRIYKIIYSEKFVQYPDKNICKNFNLKFQNFVSTHEMEVLYKTFV